MRRISKCLLLALISMSGCTTKSNARAQAEAAFKAGQTQVYKQMQEAQRTGILVIGNVRHPEIPWVDDLTLAEALVQADWNSVRNPSEIILIRRGERIPIDVKSLLRGKIVRLESGDTVELHP